MRSDKNSAIEMRKTGKSYNEISKKLLIPKSTLSVWFHNSDISKKIKSINQNNRSNAQSKSFTAYNILRSKLARERWIDIQNKHSKQIGDLTPRELLLVGVALYWGEGFKKTNWNVVFCNSDKTMVALMMKFFRITCRVPEEKFRAQLQLYPNISNLDAIHYWSVVTGISIKQFTKPIRVISKSSKLKRGNTLPFGTIRIRINDVVLINTLKGWISGLSGC